MESFDFLHSYNPPFLLVTIREMPEIKNPIGKLTYKHTYFMKIENQFLTDLKLYKTLFFYMKQYQIENCPK